MSIAPRRAGNGDNACMADAPDPVALWIDEVRLEFRRYKTWADQAIAQVDDEAFFATIDPEANSVAHVVKHVAGNLRSRWTDFYAADGEKPDRWRDREFEIEPGDTRASLLARWEAGWACLFATLDPMTPADAARGVVIRDEPHTVPRALMRSLAHTAQHVGQIILLAKHQRGGAWRTISVPRGQSETFNATMREKFAREAGKDRA
jgi:uncharacterized protein DUF1572